MSSLLEVKDLRTYFYTLDGLVKAVDGVSYEMKAGEILGLVGESGCGKSISALSILRLIPSPPGKIVGGQVFYQGRDLLTLGNDDIRKIRGNEIAMIFQEPMTSLNPVLTIGRQLSEPLEVHQNMSQAEARRECIRLMDTVQISDGEFRLNDYPHQYSGGMRQRVMIAMALSCRPKLLIADEPTTAIDVTIQAQLLELMKTMTREAGTALLIITHNLGVIARYADRVNVMYAGRIVEKGNSRDIYEHPQHPYTVGLLNSVPRLDQAVKKRLVPIEGSPPDLGNLPQGCSFAPRCNYVMARCREEIPFLSPVSGEHVAACWLKIKKH
jgi:oligopeptide/dipeptide ABC transporter ATP-binding protein